MLEIPPPRLCWVSEVDSSHALRFLHRLRSSSSPSHENTADSEGGCENNYPLEIQLCHLQIPSLRSPLKAVCHSISHQQDSSQHSNLSHPSCSTAEMILSKKQQERFPMYLFTERNVVTEGNLPSEWLKHITRVFFVPYSCSELDWIHENRELRELIAAGAVFKVQASPKHLEKLVAEVLIGDSDEDGNARPWRVSPDNIHPSKCTHIVQVLYNPQEALFRWGVVSVAEAREQFMTSDALEKQVEEGLMSLRCVSGGNPPASRAYFKVQEIMEHYFLKWGWDIDLASLQDSVAVDVGASPGGWTQYLSRRCKRVMAIDPGLLLPNVLSAPNVLYVPFLAESPETQTALAEFTSQQPINLCVCDMNVEPHVAAKILVDSILPFMICSSNNSDGKLVENTGYIILTLKLPRNPSERRISSSYRIACEILSGSEQKEKLERSNKLYECWDFHMVHLHANSRNERTLACKICKIR